MNAEDDAPALESDVASVASSGVRVERETTPAPARAGADADADAAANEEWDALPSARPTSVPDYDVSAAAFETSLRHPRLPSLPFDVAVPTRTSVPAPPDLELRASFLLLHIDSQSSVRDIADLTGFALEEVLACFLQLTEHGLVELSGTQSGQSIPISGARPTP